MYSSRTYSGLSHHSIHINRSKMLLSMKNQMNWCNFRHFKYIKMSVIYFEYHWKKMLYLKIMKDIIKKINRV